jgi:DNA-binding HxlR family transcriptional regulator
VKSYGQYCPIARGSEIVAERWTPIIMRNLLLGARTFNRLSAGAPGLSRTLLTRRLRELERAGLLEIHPRTNGHGSIYVPTPMGRELWVVLTALGDWAQKWMEVTPEQAGPDAVLWVWCQEFLRHDLLPERRVVIRFDMPHRGRPERHWLVLQDRQGEVCRSDPGYGDDLVVTVHDPLTFARWHLGLVGWAAALRARAIEVDGPVSLRRALPTWNRGPAIHRQRRAEHQRAIHDLPPPLPPEADLTLNRPAGRAAVRPRGSPGQIPDFAGQLITRSSEEYDLARAVWNGAIDRHPRYIARCTSAADVTAALRFGLDSGLPVSVRAGGHGVAGTAVCDDGLVIDLAPMKAITVNPADHTATVQPGVLWGELDAATQAFELATTGGVVSHTGVAGLTLGGGIGWLMRRHGLTVDNLLAAEVVTSGGRRVTASAAEHPDLFWGLRGGGGTLGVVTAFTFRLHRVSPEVLAGPVLWALEQAPDVLHTYREWAASAPPEVATTITLRRAPRASFLPAELHGRPVCMISMMALAEPGAAERLLRRPRGWGRPLLDLVRYRPYSSLQTLGDAAVPHGWHYYWKSAGLRRLNDHVIATLADHAGRAGSPLSYTVIFQLGGAVADADPASTAYSRRHLSHEVNINAVWLPHQPIGAREREWARQFAAALPQDNGGYLNFLDHDDQHRRAAAFQAGAYRRLEQLQNHYDLDAVFRPHLPASP